MAAHSLGKSLLLIAGAELEELLDDVVAEDVGHEAVGGRQDLVEYHALLRRRGSLQLLLNEPVTEDKDIVISN